MFPCKITASASTLAFWRDDEFGSWEDHGRPESGHVYPILGRMKTRVVVENEEEARLLLRSADYHGDPSAWGDDRTAYRLAVSRLAVKIHEEIDAAEFVAAMEEA